VKDDGWFGQRSFDISDLHIHKAWKSYSIREPTERSNKPETYTKHIVELEK